MEGWIALNRSIRSHWVWRSNFHAKRWIDLLFLAAWKDHDVDLGKRTIHLKRGQILTSTRHLMGIWKTNTSTVLDFLRSLEKSNMITRTRSGNVTIIDICNYDYYQFMINPQEKGAENTSNHELKTVPNAEEDSYPKATPKKKKLETESEHHQETKQVTTEQDNNIKKNSSLSLRKREEDFFNEVIASQSFIEDVAKNHQLQINETLNWLKKFFGYTTTVAHWHTDLRDFKDHFFKWLAIKIEAKRNATGKQKNGDSSRQDKYAARRGTDVGDKKASDYGGSF